MQPRIYLAGIDPSTNYIGLSIFEINPVDFKITGIHTRTINTADLITYNNIDRQEYVNNFLYKYFTDLFRNIPIYYLAIESAFINKFRISSYGPLTRVIQTIRLAYVNTYRLNHVVEYAPLYIKKTIGKEFYYDKEGTKQAVLSIPDIRKYINSNLSEHEYDALAINWILYDEIRKHKELLFMP
jgi:Holliday junction resolvasome RuvABC endonuclease subunit